MERLFAGRLDEVSAAIAMHLERGGQPARAVPFLERAAAVATRVWANEEAVRCLTHALSLLDSLPPGRDRDDQELVLRSSLSAALNSARGYAAPELEQNLERVFALSSADGRGEVPVGWLWAAGALRFMLGDLKTMLHVSEQALARSDRDPACACEAHHSMGGTLMSLGRLEESQRHFEAAVSSYDRDRPRASPLASDLGVFAHAWYSHTLWLLGNEPAALANVEEAVGRARRLNDRFSETIGLAYAAMLHQMRVDTDRVSDCADEVIALCGRYGFAYYGDWANALAGWVRGHEDPAAGVAQMQAALERLERNRAQARRPHYLSLLAELHSWAGRRDPASATVDAAITMAVARDDAWWLPALYFQKSEFGPADAKAATLRQALATARAQRNRGLEQRILPGSFIFERPHHLFVHGALDHQMVDHHCLPLPLAP
jgi:tetratricopeptide (TPR) repeat protein